MKVGDLVKYGRKSAAASNRMGIVVEIHHRVIPTAVVLWNGLSHAMAHRQDLLEVVSEDR